MASAGEEQTAGASKARIVVAFVAKGKRVVEALLEPVESVPYQSTGSDQHRT